MSATDNDAHADSDCSFYAHKFNIPDIASDPTRWNKEWEKALSVLSSQDVFLNMSKPWKQDQLEASKLSMMTQELNDRLCKLQGIVVKLWDELEAEGGHLVSAWLLLDEGERKRHLMNGIKKACEAALFAQDARALCPEITLSSMSKQKGRAFIDFVSDYAKAVKNMDAGTAYYLPGEWWQKAVDMPEPCSEEVQSTFRFLTIGRNKFIARFVSDALMSVLHDLCYGSPGMDAVTDMMKSDALFASAWAKTVSSIRDKPVIRCENCTKTPEEIGKNVKFMRCSNCKSKLNFVVHYCSQACQKEDWRKHKKHCGKEKKSNNLSGTAHDPFWAIPDVPDHFRSVEPDPNGDISITSIGFGAPHPARPHSQALQRQVALFTRDKHTEYFLFDDMDRPIRVILCDMWTRMTFRTLRADAITSADQRGLEAIVQYLIKIMGNKPGLSRERILAQFSREYGDDVPERVAEFESRATANGYEPGTTFLETMSKSLMKNVPAYMNRGA